MARPSVTKRYLYVVAAILLITVLSVYLIETRYQEGSSMPAGLSKAETFEQVERLGTPFTVESLDPVRAKNILEIGISSLIYQPLFVRPSDQAKALPSAMLAEVVWEDGRLYLTLDREAFFHSKRRIGAEDVQVSLERALAISRAEGLGFEGLFSPLSGLEDFLTGRAEHISGIELLADNRLSLAWQGEPATLKNALSLVETSILEARSLQENQSYGLSWKAGLEPSINGSHIFRIASWNQDCLVLKKNKKDAVDPEPRAQERIEIHFEGDRASIFQDIRLGILDGGLLRRPAGPEALAVFQDSLEPVERLLSEDRFFLLTQPGLGAQQERFLSQVLLEKKDAFFQANWTLSLQTPGPAPSSDAGPSQSVAQPPDTAQAGQGLEGPLILGLAPELSPFLDLFSDQPGLTVQLFSDKQELLASFRAGSLDGYLDTSPYGLETLEARLGGPENSLISPYARPYYLYPARLDEGDKRQNFFMDFVRDLDL